MEELRWTLLCCFLLAVLVISKVTAGTDCHDAAGSELECEPPFANVAFNAKIEATNSDGSSTHAPQYMVDEELPGANTEWRSKSLYDQQQDGKTGMVQSNITINFGTPMDITYIRIKFASPRPASFSIYKKTTPSSQWEAYQFYSPNCESVYGVKTNSLPETGTEALCTDHHSEISPLSGGIISFSTHNNRWQLRSKPQQQQEFRQASVLQFRLHTMNTFGDEAFGEKSVLESYYYAISDISVGGRCQCNGHADTCVSNTPASSSSLGGGLYSCVCQHGTSGSDCSLSADMERRDNADPRCVRPGNSTQEQMPCSGRGVCFDGVCDCDHLPGCTPDMNICLRYTGRFCECQCPSNSQGVCSSRGRCVCDEDTSLTSCVCEAGYTGHQCDCPLSTDSCVDKTGSPDVLCSGKGLCQCGVCICEKREGATGRYCEVISGGSSGGHYQPSQPLVNPDIANKPGRSSLIKAGSCPTRSGDVKADCMKAGECQSDGGCLRKRKCCGCPAMCSRPIF